VPVLDSDSQVGEAEIGFAEWGGDPLVDTDPETGEPTGIVTGASRSISLEVTLGGTAIANVLSVEIQTGWDQMVATATIALTGLPYDSGGNDISLAYNQEVVVTAGTTPTPPGTVARRFVGLLKEQEWSLYPRTLVLHCQDYLSLLDEYVMDEGDIDEEEGTPGLSLEGLLGTADGGTLKEIVEAVLWRVSDAFDGLLAWDSANLADPPHVYGTEGPEVFTWPRGAKASDYLADLFRATAGYRLFSSGDGNIYMPQVIGRPRDETDLAFRQGVDIFAAGARRSIVGAKNQIKVVGYDWGDVDGPLEWTEDAPNDYQPDAGTHVYTHNSGQIETEALAADIAVYWAQEYSREIVRIDGLESWRDDVQGPAQTHLVDALDRLGTGEPLWCLRHTIRVGETWTVSNSYVGGGLPLDYTPVPIS
jgi:hypothetical protein